MIKSQLKDKPTSALIKAGPITVGGPVMRAKEGRVRAPSITEHLVENLKIPLVSDCARCLGLGFLYGSDFHFQNNDKSQSGFVLCSCIAGLCGEERCYPPYERYEAQVQAIRPCECRPARISLERICILERRACIPRKYAGRFLEHIRLEHAPGTSLILAISHAEEIVSHFRKDPASPQGLYLHGGTGCGKTLLSCAILNELLRFHKASVRYAKISRDILSKLRASYNRNSETYGEGLKIEEELASVEVLVIDDFGIHRETNWVQSVLYDLIDARYESNLLTIITSNEPMSFWKDTAGGRVYSRLREMCKEISIEAPDYRIETHDSKERL